MRNHLIAVAVLGASLLIPKAEAQAQFSTPYAYNNNAYVNYAIASQKARAAGRKARASKKSGHKRRSSKQRARRHRR